MARPNIPHEALTIDRLRWLWKNSDRESDQREALAEVARLHGVLARIYKDLEIIEREYRSNVGGHLVALYDLRRILSDEPAIVATKFRR